MHLFRRSLLIAVAVVGCSAGVAPAAHAASRTVIFDLFPTPLDQPKTVYFTADAGPYMKDITWTGWGTSTAVGSGTYVECAHSITSCDKSDVVERPATYTLTELLPCPRFGSDTTTYRYGEVANPTTEYPKNGFDFSSDYDFCAKLPTTAAATKAIKAKVRKRGAVSKFSVKCKKGYDGSYLDCTARFTQKGKRRVRYFEVSGRVGKSPLLSETFAP